MTKIIKTLQEFKALTPGEPYIWEHYTATPGEDVVAFAEELEAKDAKIFADEPEGGDQDVAKLGGLTVEYLKKTDVDTLTKAQKRATAVAVAKELDIKYSGAKERDLWTAIVKKLNGVS